MDFKENTSKIFAAHSKANAIILSCKNLGHLETAKRYVENFKRMCNSVKCNNNLQREFIKKIISDVETTLRIKRKAIQ